MAEKKAKAEMSFEKALEELEVLIEAMEQGDVPLAKLVSQYEKGKKLLGTCQEQLKDAELKILKASESGQGIILEPFEKEEEK
ncbi:MAG: exodeoxyribonuclease VII small subunit [Verrucomicrobia bacterium CG_4_10_14_3_um_filter_43_23]|nr:MAG: exodeoxyribonuclease VII small subunit [Verrucomicrobia bacterium CG1_02_43_26]PIP59868.1 MAG: exodeoxyribonuclease VII small subunit [Verrucomicrobia bacterium CG22_combo_CG10-13_8_21_14_all_43_17]PIX58418.1 MAG: exodeoxyribonuclease VII small subunit [Verrucomicrobia bacterium CG_4_10_14_3_um_filter_43_23]PIY61566.1 MAG: exodeoxyribonuclease VII small subunit [Verrucomicrobia bacterium CG_4_10_14_0_8_um_filter_43_34]PJA43643.1 MAG: exodeoxyribonuclease VII small subunit [Verrucomicrob